MRAFFVSEGADAGRLDEVGSSGVCVAMLDGFSRGRHESKPVRDTVRSTRYCRRPSPTALM